MFLRRRVAEMACLLAFAAVAGCGSNESATSAPPAARPQPSAAAGPIPQPLTFEIAPDLPRLQTNIANAARPAEVVRAAYKFASDHPEVLKYVPCFCGCERAGHQGNDDCFVTKRNAQGKAESWEPHGAVCEICIDVATLASQMHASGASVRAIRDAVDKKYARPDRPHTPTPQPKGGTHEH